ncbi:MAG TPA: hypothetical protein VFL27_04175 [Candidatus Dormibacteraeota bacterium]|nr:hypothetical protein [Candidatus Dormibacteraeota bacterium]
MSVSERKLGEERRHETMPVREERRHDTRTVPGPPADPPQGSMRTNSETADAEARNNPEVMGRKEPRTVEPRRSEMWPDMADYQRRFDQLQSDFIEDPKSAVQKAERLMEEAIDSFTRSMRERMKSAHKDTDGHADTEQMRLTMRSYRDFIQSLGGRRAA